MFQSNTYRIMIGNPSDIVEEVSIAKEVILKWSCLNAESHNIVLLPLHWTDNAYPGTGQHPQKMLDRILVDKSDMLICIFGSKIGTATDTHDSGSIEEIEEHIKAGKQVMIFFKRNGNVLNIDLNQIKKLQSFRNRIKNTTMWWEYDSANDFRKLLEDKLQLFINDHWLNQPIVATKTEEPEIKYKYGEFELVIFSKWANNTVDKQYMAVWTRLGLEVHMGYHNGYTFARGEELAEFEDYINRLCDDGLIKYDKTNDKGIKIYSITKKGYDFARTLPKYDDNNNVVS